MIELNWTHRFTKSMWDQECVMHFFIIILQVLLVAPSSLSLRKITVKELCPTITQRLTYCFTHTHDEDKNHPKVPYYFQPVQDINNTLLR